MEKKILYFNEYNLLMGSEGVSYLPFVSGILSANAKKINILNDSFKFKEFIFNPDTPENIIKNYYNEKPDIAVFSISMWNEQLSLAVARYLKKKWNPLIIFGGASCPHDPTDYFKKYEFIDVAVRAEGEDAFNEILKSFINKKNYDGIANVAYRSEKNECIINTNKIAFNRDLDIYPSPYLTGEFDYLFNENKNHKFQIIIETNRGCPFLCTYCYWGRGGTTTKYRHHSLERVFAEIDWIAEKKIKYVFNADSNFGMHKRDMDIAKKLVETKKKFGYPEKFRTCWGKNTSEQIFQIASLLNLYDMEKGVTLARQTNSEVALKNVKRDNIKLDAYSELEKNFNKLNIPVYAEMILGLPGETYESWVDGLTSLIDTSVNNQIFIYQAEIYPNTEMNELDYKKKHGIKSTRIKLKEIHCSPREQEWLKEYQDIVTETSSMDVKDWKKRNVFSIVLMVMHSFKVGYYYLNYFSKDLNMSSKKFLEAIINFSNHQDTPFIFDKVMGTIERWTNNLLKGEGRGIYKQQYSDVYLDIEEFVFLELSKDWTKVYDELDFIIKNLLSKENKYEENRLILDDIKKYQLLRMPKVNGVNESIDLEFNIAEYMFYNISEKKVQIKKIRNTIKSINVKNFENDTPSFVKFKIIWARKSDKIKNEIDYDFKIVESIREQEKINLNNNSSSEKSLLEKKESSKPILFDKQNKFEKYNSLKLEIKNNRRI
jgi:radical SAM superfamily enzyme YgiQ (UPF0313 family)